MMRALTDDERAHFRGRMVKHGVAAHFTIDGNTFNPVFGTITKDRNANIINKTMFWNFTADDAKEIARLCGVKVRIGK